MKLRALTFICSSCDAAHSFLSFCRKRVQDVHVWAWTRATKENVRTCNARIVARS